jgi:hypothetical protein
MFAMYKYSALLFPPPLFCTRNNNSDSISIRISKDKCSDITSIYASPKTSAVDVIKKTAVNGDRVRVTGRGGGGGGGGGRGVELA